MTALELPTRGVWTSSDAYFSAATSFKSLCFLSLAKGARFLKPQKGSCRTEEWSTEPSRGSSMAWLHRFLPFWMKASRTYRMHVVGGMWGQWKNDIFFLPCYYCFCYIVIGYKLTSLDDSAYVLSLHYWFVYMRIRGYTIYVVWANILWLTVFFTYIHADIFSFRSLHLD